MFRFIRVRLKLVFNHPFMYILKIKIYFIYKVITVLEEAYISVSSA